MCSHLVNQTLTTSAAKINHRHRNQQQQQWRRRSGAVVGCASPHSQRRPTWWRSRTTNERQRRTWPTSRATTVSALRTAPKIDASPPQQQQQQRQCQGGGGRHETTDATSGRRRPLLPDLSPIAMSVCQTSFAKRHCYEQFYRAARRAVGRSDLLCGGRCWWPAIRAWCPWAINDRHITSSKYPLTKHSVVISRLMTRLYFSPSTLSTLCSRQPVPYKQRYFTRSS